MINRILKVIKGQSVNLFRLTFLYLLFLPVAANAAETKTEKYKSQSAPGLELCKEFKAYLERHADKPLYCGLVPDPDFKDFRLPKLQSAPKGVGERITFQARTVPSDLYQTLGVEYQLEEYQKAIKELNALIDSNAKFEIGIMDINHDGRKEPVLVRSEPNLCAEDKIIYTSVMPYHETQNIDSAWVDKNGYPEGGGEPFYYKGRVYLITGSANRIHIYEPTTFQSNKLLTGRSICNYRPL